MKLLVNGNQEIAELDMSVNGVTGTCSPIIRSCGYQVEMPQMKTALVSDKETDGLRIDLELPDVMDAAILVSKDDVKKLKGLMNKDAIKFLLKALM